MKNGRLIFFVLALFALFSGLSWGLNRRMAGARQPDYTMFSTGEHGVSLLHDTLTHMRFPVGILYRPVSRAGLNDAVFVIQPTNPRIGADGAEEILSWVRRGGRLIFLENRQPTVIDRALEHEIYMPFGSLRVYQHGMGEIVTGRADSVANVNLLGDTFYGQAFAYILAGWNPERIYFAEYYHGHRQEQSAFQQMPPWLRLAAFQIIIAAAAFVWHYGKRFGRPVPLYEETERGENEQVLTLARLYKQADRRS